MIGTKWKPHETVEFKHVVEFSERAGRMSDDSMLLGHVWNEMQSAKGRVKTLERKALEGLCALAGPGRGDCEHAVGLPGKSMPGEHDGPDDTVDCYGKPNGWCQRCWDAHRIEKLKADAVEMAKCITYETELAPGIVDQYLDQPADV